MILKRNKRSNHNPRLMTTNAKTMCDDDGFTCVNRKQDAEKKRRQKQDSKKAYVDYCRNVWPTALKAHVERCMDVFFTKQPKRSDETMEMYQERANRAREAVLRRAGDCGLSYEKCIEKGHPRCEENRRTGYELWCQDESLRRELESIQIAEEDEIKEEAVTLPVPVPVPVPQQHLEEEKAKTKTVKQRPKKEKKVKIVDPEFEAVMEFISNGDNKPISRAKK